MEIIPSVFEHPRILYEISLRREPLVEVISETTYMVTYKDPSDLIIYIKTDERVDEREGRLFDGYGLRYGKFGHIIFEHEEEYDASIKISEASEDDEELPF